MSPFSHTHSKTILLQRKCLQIDDFIFISISIVHGHGGGGGVAEVGTEDGDGVGHDEVLGGVLVHVGIPVSNSSLAVGISGADSLLEEGNMLHHLVLSLQPLGQGMDTSLALLAGHLSHGSLATSSKFSTDISSLGSHKVIQNRGEPVIDELCDVAWISGLVAVVMAQILLHHITQISNGSGEVLETLGAFLTGGSGLGIGLAR